MRPRKNASMSQETCGASSASSCGPTSSCEPSASCCRMEALISVDERGQMVLPKELRERLGIRPGGKLALFLQDKGGDPCCFFLVKAERLGDLAQTLLGPQG